MGAAYGRLLASVGTTQFGPTVLDSVMSLTSGAQRLYLFEAASHDDTSLHYFHGEPGLAELFPAYRKWYLRQDPVWEAYRLAADCSDIVVQRLQPLDIASLGFRRRIFENAGIVERISVIQRGEDAWRVLNVARHASNGCCSDEELGALVDLACLVLPMLPLHRRHTRSALPLTAHVLEERFACRFHDLPLRERQVCARAAMGMTVEATAQELGIARTSVLTYRQHAYQRLGVTSPIALCALVTH
jgi:DNA-binding NarL/FixJ family response regulator